MAQEDSASESSADPSAQVDGSTTFSDETSGQSKAALFEKIDQLSEVAAESAQQASEAAIRDNRQADAETADADMSEGEDTPVDDPAAAENLPQGEEGFDSNADASSDMTIEELEKLLAEQKAALATVEKNREDTLQRVQEVRGKLEQTDTEREQTEAEILELCQQQNELQPGTLNECTEATADKAGN